MMSMSLEELRYYGALLPEDALALKRNEDLMALYNYLLKLLWLDHTCDYSNSYPPGARDSARS
jgi:hypothetical protein